MEKGAIHSMTHTHTVWVRGLGEPPWYTSTACHTHCMGERVGSASMVHLPPDSQPPGRRVEVLGRAGALASLDPAEICREM